MDSKFDMDFIESRRDALNEWLIYVGSHPLLSTSLDLRSFLSTNFIMDTPLSADNIMLKTKSALTSDHNALSSDESIRNLLSRYKFPDTLEKEAEKTGIKAYATFTNMEKLGSTVDSLGNSMKSIGSVLDGSSENAKQKSTAAKTVAKRLGKDPDPAGGVFWRLLGRQCLQRIQPCMLRGQMHIGVLGVFTHFGGPSYCLKLDGRWRLLYGNHHGMTS